MNATRELRKRFFKRYYDVKLGLNGLVTKRMKHFLHGVDVVIIDTDNIASDTLTYHNVSLGDPEKCLRAVTHATYGAEELTYRSLARAVPVIEATYEPVVIDVTTTYARTVWHEGALYCTYGVGTPGDLLPYLDCTENEREHIINECRRALADGFEPYITASATHPTLDTPLHGMEFLGIVIVARELLPDALAAVTSLRDHGITVRYLSKDPEYIVSSLAHRVGILMQNEHPCPHYHVTNRPDECIVIAALSEHTYDTLRTGNNPLSILVCKDSIVTFSEMYEASSR